MEDYLPYILTGCIFYAFGIRWCYEYAKLWCWSGSREDSTKGLKFFERCGNLLHDHPIEGSCKLIATAAGLTGTLINGLPDANEASQKVVYATIYLFFAFSGLIDVLHFYFPRNVSDGLVKLALGQSLFVEGFLLFWADLGIVTMILCAVVWLTSLVLALELVWPEMKLLRGCLTLLHGSWIAHTVRMYEFLSPATVALTFTWHLAAASAVTLCIVAVTRSCAPDTAIDQPPELPIYDYSQEPDPRV